MIEVSSNVAAVASEPKGEDESDDPAIRLAERVRDNIRKETSCEGTSCLSIIEE